MCSIPLGRSRAYNALMAAKTLEQKFGERVRKCRHAAGLSQLDMLHHGFSLSHYQKMERGVIDPRLSTLVKLAKAFGVSVGELGDKL